MPTQLEFELVRFHQFISERLHSGKSTMSPEEVLDLWRAENPASDDFVETVADLQESFADMEAGDRGTPLDQLDREFRRKHQMDAPPA